jgi:hypothetical protein
MRMCVKGIELASTKFVIGFWKCSDIVCVECFIFHLFKTIKIIFSFWKYRTNTFWSSRIWDNRQSDYTNWINGLYQLLCQIMFSVPTTKEHLIMLCYGSNHSVIYTLKLNQWRFKCHIESLCLFLFINYRLCTHI